MKELCLIKQTWDPMIKRLWGFFLESCCCHMLAAALHCSFDVVPVLFHPPEGNLGIVFNTKFMSQLTTKAHMSPCQEAISSYFNWVTFIFLSTPSHAFQHPYFLISHLIIIQARRSHRTDQLAPLHPRSSERSSFPDLAHKCFCHTVTACH